MMRCGHLFNGISGFGLAAHWMGWENIMHCEIDPFCNRVMNHHFPNSYQHEDIRTTDFTIWRGKIDLVTGGFPCQPYSTAGKRKGTADDRHLWPQMLRAIREIQPGYIVGENVRGLTNWNRGLVFDEVQADLEAEGYEVFPFLLPACAVNAPHRRDRIWFVAYNSNAGIEGLRSGKDKVYGSGITPNAGRVISDRREIDGYKQSVNNGQNKGREEETDKPERLHQESYVADAKSCGLQIGNDKPDRGRSQSIVKRFNGPGDWQNFPTQSPICGRNDGLPGRLVDITFPRWRRESIKALGNAIVPQVAYQLFKAIQTMNL